MTHRSIYGALFFLTAGILFSDQNMLLAEVSPGATNNDKMLGVEETLKTLQMIAAQIQGNSELIKTWTGKYDFTDRFCFPGRMPGAAASGEANGAGFCETSAGTLEFQWDVALDHLHVFYQPTKALEYSDVSTGKRLKREDVGDIYHWIITPEHWIEFGSNVDLGQIKEFPNVPSVAPQGGRVVKRKIRKEADRYVRIFKPTNFFSNGATPFWLHCKLYADALAGKRSPEEKKHVETNARLVQRSSPRGSFVLTVEYPGPGITDKNIGRIQTVFDSATGFQPTSWIRTVGERTAEKRTITYKELSGIFVPATFSYEMYDIDRAEIKVPKLSRAFTFKSSSLNTPIPAARFGIEQFELKYGERMMDEIENRLYVQDKTGLVPADRFTIVADKRPVVYTGQEPSRGTNWTLIIGNVIVIIGLALLAVLRRRKSMNLAHN